MNTNQNQSRPNSPFRLIASTAAAGLVFCAMPVAAQKPATVPSQLRMPGVTVFLANGGAPAVFGNKAQVSHAAYTSLYASLSTDGHYSLVGAPSNAELSMVISTRPEEQNSCSLRLEIHDTKTGALLWAVEEPVLVWSNETKLQKSVAQGVASLMSDLKTLNSGGIPGDPALNPQKKK